MLGVAKNDKGPFTKPSVVTVKNKEYTISRSLQIYTRGEAKGDIKKFIDYILSPKGQDILKQTGFVPL